MYISYTSYINCFTPRKNLKFSSFQIFSVLLIFLYHRLTQWEKTGTDLFELVTHVSWPSIKVEPSTIFDITIFDSLCITACKCTVLLRISRFSFEDALYFDSWISLGPIVRLRRWAYTWYRLWLEDWWDAGSCSLEPSTPHGATWLVRGPSRSPRPWLTIAGAMLQWWLKAHQGELYRFIHS